MVMRYLGGINNPSYNPLAANVTTGVTTVQQGGIYTSSSASQNIPTGQWVDDPFFNQTTLLLQADNAVNGAQNNTFLDSSVNNFTVTRNATMAQGSFSPFSVPAGYWSSFNTNNSTGYLTVTGNSSLAFSTNNFTIECLFYLTALPNPNAMLYDARPSATDGAYPCLFIAVTTNVLTYYVNTAARITGTTALSINQWYHVVVSRVSGNTRMFLNGVQQGSTYADTTTYLNGTSRPLIGNNGLNLNGYFFGYISNVRVLNGTGTTAPTVPTSPLTPVPNTQLLTCQSNRYVDNSTNNFTITKSGDSAIRSFTPFNNNVPQFNGPTGTGSILFPGTADNAATFTGTTIPIGQTNFTIEGWVYITANNSGIWPCMVGDMVGGGGSDINWSFGPRSNNKLSFQYRTGTNVYGPSTLRTTTALVTNTWNYVAASCEGNTLRLYINGVQQSLDSGGDSYGIGARLETSGFTTVGSIPNGGAGNAFSGLISNLSITNGTAKYTGTTFTVPTGPLPAVATNQVLLFASPFAVDSNATVAPKAVTITGAVRNNIGSPFATPPVGFPTAGGSAFFDGNSSLSLTGSSILAFSGNDFSIEFWWYSGSPSTTQILYDSRANGVASGAYPTIYTPSGIITYFVNGANRVAANSASASNTWIHVVVSRASGTTRMFINGVQQTQTFADTTTYINGANRPILGRGDNPASTLILGYVSDMRVITNVGVTSVTVPTAPLLPIANTQLLLSCTNSGIVDATRGNDFSTVGNAQVSTAVKKYGSGSMFFDGTGDWLLYPDNPDINFGTGDFTIEGWINFSDTGAQRSIAAKGVAGSTGWELYCNSTPTLLIFVYGGSITYSNSYNFIVGQWYHVAVVRSGTGIGNIKMFINGFLIFESAVAVNNDLTTIQPLYVGAGRGGGTPFFGYIDDFRLTKGYARYTSTFNPPTVALPRQG
jgi:hypothetical protein